MRWLSLAALLFVFAVGDAHAAGLADALCGTYKDNWDRVSGQTNIGSLEAVARNIPKTCPIYPTAMRRIDDLKAKAREKAAAAHQARREAASSDDDQTPPSAPDIPTAPMPVQTTPPLQWSPPVTARAPVAASAPASPPPTPAPAPVIEAPAPVPAPVPAPPPPVETAPTKPEPIAVAPTPPPQPAPTPEVVPQPTPAAVAPPPPVVLTPTPAPPPPAPPPSVAPPTPAPTPRVIAQAEPPKPAPAVAPPVAKPAPARRTRPTKPAPPPAESPATDPQALAAKDETAGEAAYAAGNLPLADTLLNRALNEGEDTGDNHYWLGRLSASQGKPRGAIAQFNTAIQKTADDSNGDQRRVYFERAKSEYVVGDYAAALADFAKFKAMADAANVDLGYDFYFDRGQTNLTLGNNADAVADYAAALKSQPDDRAAFFGRGVGNARVSNFVGAISDLHDAIRLETQANTLDFQTYYFLGIAEFLQGDKQTANGDFTRAEKLDDGTMKNNVQCLMDDVQLPSLVMKMTRMGAACQKIDAPHELIRPVTLGPLAP